ncbi:MAG: DUF1294 domain-containing protein [Rhodanobacter sp.]
MRFAGRITDWNDEKGFGFVVPNGGGSRAFVHINQFPRGARRPVIGDRVSYLTVLDERGRTNARQIRHAGQKMEVARVRARTPRAVLGVVALAIGVTVFAAGVLPTALFAAYVGMSGLSYLMYGWDKASAKNGRQRTPENQLHLADLLGGWPGALIAQQQFHHKTVKQPFQTIFWITVMLNIAICVWLVRSGLAAELTQLFNP